MNLIPLSDNVITKRRDMIHDELGDDAEDIVEREVDWVINISVWTEVRWSIYDQLYVDLGYEV